MKNNVGLTAHYGDSHLLLRLKTQQPADLHRKLLHGLQLAQKLGFLAEDLTRDEKEALLALNEVATLLLPCDTCLEMLQKDREAKKIAVSLC